MKTNIILVILAILINVYHGKTETGEKLYIIDNVGYHLVNAIEPVALKNKLVPEYFSEKKHHLAKRFLKTYSPKSFNEIRKNNKAGKYQNKQIKHIKGKPFAEVSRFSKKTVYIRILQKVGEHRWHQYFYCHGLYKIKRDKYIDESFKLKKEMAKFSFTYNGIGHGASLSDLINRLGKPDYKYPGQSPQLQKYYYVKHNIFIYIHNFRVYYIKKMNVKPGYLEKWIKKK